MVVKGKDIEMLLLKKQLCQKFSDFDLVQIDPVPQSISKRISFVPGVAELGKIVDPDNDEVGVSLHHKSNSTSGMLIWRLRDEDFIYIIRKLTYFSLIVTLDCNFVSNLGGYLLYIYM